MLLDLLNYFSKLTLQGCANSSDQYREHFQDDLKKLGCSFVCKTVFVPSFLEEYPFCLVRYKLNAYNTSILHVLTK